MSRARAEGLFSVELEAFPFVRLRSPLALEHDSVDVGSFFVCVALACAREQPFVVLHDARGMPYVDEPRQSAFLSQLAHFRPLIVRRTIAYAVVAHSPLERGLVTALRWSANLPIPIKLFGDEADARAFLLERYQRHTRALCTLS